MAENAPATQPGDPQVEEQKAVKKALEDQETLAKAVADLDELLRQEKLNPAEKYKAAVGAVLAAQPALVLGHDAVARPTGPDRCPRPAAWW